MSNSRLLRGLKGTGKRVAQNQEGSVAIATAIMFFVFMLICAMTLDLSSSRLTRTRLQLVADDLAISLVTNIENNCQTEDSCDISEIQNEADNELKTMNCSDSQGDACKVTVSFANENRINVKLENVNNPTFFKSFTKVNVINYVVYAEIDVPVKLS